MMSHMNKKLSTKRKVLLVIAGVFVLIGLLYVGDIFADTFGGNGSKARACEEAYTETIKAVDGVSSVTVDCSLQFGGGWQRVTVNLDAASDADAAPIADKLLRALAADERLNNTWMIPRTFALSDGENSLEIFTKLGFDGAPSSIGELRDYYDIHP